MCRFFVFAAACAFGLTTVLGQNRGIANDYPGNKNIVSDPRVLFIEDFEAPNMDTLTEGWESVRESGLGFSERVPPGSSGSRSLSMTQLGGTNNSPSLYRRLGEGHDRVHARFYVWFDPDCWPVHHFGTTLGGHNPAVPWPAVKAGVRQPLDKTFWVGVEPFGQKWTWDYYAYWGEMRGSPPAGKTWGNSFIHNPELTVEQGQWICLELMVQMNDPESRNGQLALWIDGEPVSHLREGAPKGRWTYDKFLPGRGGEGIRWDDDTRAPVRFPVAEGGEPFEGFRWRSTEALNINYLWLYLYITTAPEGHESVVLMDDVVVATEYIGPLAKATP